MTDPVHTETLAKLVDRQQVWDCLVRYTRGVDRIDLDLIRSAFWPDAIITQGPLQGSVDTMISMWQPGQAGRDVTYHSLSNFHVELDGNQAHSEAYLLVAIKQKTSDRTELVGGRYIDHLEKRGGEWRIRTRLMVIEWQGKVNSSEMAARMATRHQGSRDRNDPSYERPVMPREPINTPWLPTSTS